MKSIKENFYKNINAATVRDEVKKVWNDILSGKAGVICELDNKKFICTPHGDIYSLSSMEAYYRLIKTKLTLIMISEFNIRFITEDSIYSFTPLFNLKGQGVTANTYKRPGFIEDTLRRIKNSF